MTISSTSFSLPTAVNCQDEMRRIESQLERDSSKRLYGTGIGLATSSTMATVLLTHRRYNGEIRQGSTQDFVFNHISTNPQYLFANIKAVQTFGHDRGKFSTDRMIRINRTTFAVKTRNLRYHCDFAPILDQRCYKQGETLHIKGFSGQDNSFLNLAFYLDN